MSLYRPDPSPPCDTPHNYLDDAIAEMWEAYDRSIAGKANCGCHYHAEEGVPCEHDIALAASARRKPASAADVARFSAHLRRKR